MVKSLSGIFLSFGLLIAGVLVGLSINKLELIGQHRFLIYTHSSSFPFQNFLIDHFYGLVVFSTLLFFFSTLIVLTFSNSWIKLSRIAILLLQPVTLAVAIFFPMTLISASLFFLTLLIKEKTLIISVQIVVSIVVAFFFPMNWASSIGLFLLFIVLTQTPSSWKIIIPPYFSGLLVITLSFITSFIGFTEEFSTISLELISLCTFILATPFLVLIYLKSNLPQTVIWMVLIITQFVFEWMLGLITVSILIPFLLQLFLSVPLMSHHKFWKPKSPLGEILYISLLGFSILFTLFAFNSFQELIPGGNIQSVMASEPLRMVLYLLFSLLLFSALAVLLKRDTFRKFALQRLTFVMIIIFTLTFSWKGIIKPLISSNKSITIQKR